MTPGTVVPLELLAICDALPDASDSVPLMCGIVGIRRFDGAPVDEDAAAPMAAGCAHRGPDGDGLWTDGPVGFGHRRLSIIDLAGSPQPMASADGRLHVTFNGEILNYRELRAGAAATPSGPQGDTEVAARRSSPSTVLTRVERLRRPVRVRGARRTRAGSLLLVRDRLGILPLYYYATDRLLAFASEVKALLPALPGPPQVDDGEPRRLPRRCGSVPAPWTLFAGHQQAAAGPPRCASAPTAPLRVDRCWSLPASRHRRATEPRRRRSTRSARPSSSAVAAPWSPTSPSART